VVRPTTYAVAPEESSPGIGEGSCLRTSSALRPGRLTGAIPDREAGDLEARPPACSVYGQVTPDEMRLPNMPHLLSDAGLVLPPKTENALGPAAARPFV
jgi:hypothetical protein